MIIISGIGVMSYPTLACIYILSIKHLIFILGNKKYHTSFSFYVHHLRVQQLVDVVNSKSMTKLGADKFHCHQLVTSLCFSFSSRLEPSFQLSEHLGHS